jgi:hypothetical protein
VIADEIVAKANPDGYTLLVAAVAVMTVNVSLLPKFDPVKDFAPITKFASVPNMLVALIVSGAHGRGRDRLREANPARSPGRCRASARPGTSEWSSSGSPRASR